MNKTLKYGTLTLIVAGGLLVGPKTCARFEKKKAEHNAETEYDQERALAEQDKKYETFIIDSVMSSKGFKSNEDIYSQMSDLNYQIYDLAWQNSPGGALEKAVFDAGCQIVWKHMDMLIMDLAKYGLEIANVIDITNDMCKNPEVIMYGAYKDANTEDTYNAHDYFADQIIKNIHMGSYGEMRQSEIAKIVNDDLSKMFSELYANRKHIEKTFADYFAGGQQCINDNAVSYYSDGEIFAGYNKEDIYYPYRITTRSVKVYDSALPVDFFGDKNATYNLEQVSKGKWRVVKKYTNGKVVKTNVFNHDVDYTISTYGSVSDRTFQPFAFYPGNNMGVHVMVDEVINVQRAKKQFKTSPKLNKQIDSLSLKIDSLSQRNQEYMNALGIADSIAQVKLKQRIAQRNRSK